LNIAIQFRHPRWQNTAVRRNPDRSFSLSMICNAPFVPAKARLLFGSVPRVPFPVPASVMLASR
jgi:hypothetical protein